MRCSGRICLFLGLLVIFFDAISKYWVHLSLPMMNSNFSFYPYGGIPVFKDFFGVEFSLTHLTNRGAAWGALESYQDILVGVRVALILAMIVYVCRYCKSLHWQLPLTLVIAGALGNVFDYFFYGHVVDMFHFVLWGYPFPVFNVADSSVCIGIAWLIGLSALEDTQVEVN